jgi:haloacetate dehalogenase
VDGFATAQIAVDQTSIFVRSAGHGPAVLLLHGFPETHLMWRDVAPALAERFTVICADLPGYGRSGCPASDALHQRYSKRAFARDLIEVMDRLGFPQFCVAGHDRRARVAYRLAFDFPVHVLRLAVLDIVPTETAWERADARFALGFWPWPLLAQPAPLPESVLASAADAIVDHAFAEWGSPASVAPAPVRDEYAAVLRDPEHAHAICEEYRAGATVDREHDRADLSTGRTLACPVLVLWSANGPLGTWYQPDGRSKCGDAGLRMSAAGRSRPATSFPKRSRTKPRERSPRSSADRLASRHEVLSRDDRRRDGEPRPPRARRPGRATAPANDVSP